MCSSSTLVLLMYIDKNKQDVLEKRLRKRMNDKDKCLSLQKTKRSSN